MDVKRDSRFFFSRLPPGAYRLGSQFTPGVKLLLGLFTITCFLANVSRPIANFMSEYLMLTPAQALGPKPWQLLTGPLLQMNVIQLLFTGLLLYSIGSAVEQALSTRRFLLLSVWSSLAAGLCAAAAGRILPGFADRPVQLEVMPLFMALLASFARLYGDQKVMLFGVGQQVSGRAVSWFFIGLGLFMYVIRLEWLELLAAGAAVAVGLLGGIGLSPLLELRRFFHQVRARVKRRRYKVIEGGLFSDSGTSRGQKKQQEKRWIN